jgi:hypothetical protein
MAGIFDEFARTLKALPNSSDRPSGSSDTIGFRFRTVASRPFRGLTRQPRTM